MGTYFEVSLYIISYGVQYTYIHRKKKGQS